MSEICNIPLAINVPANKGAGTFILSNIKIKINEKKRRIIR